MLKSHLRQAGDTWKKENGAEIDDHHGHELVCHVDFTATSDRSICCLCSCSKNLSNTYEYGHPLSPPPLSPPNLRQICFGSRRRRIENITNAVYGRHSLSFPPTSDFFSSFPCLSTGLLKLPVLLLGGRVCAVHETSGIRIILDGP